MNGKRCTQCKRNLLITEFSKYKHNQDGLDKRCKKCKRQNHKDWRDRNKEHLKEYRDKTKNKRNARRRELYAASPELQRKAREQVKDYRTRNPRYKRYNDVKRNYGLSKQKYDALLEQQNNKCAICKSNPGKKSLAVDHNHRTGKVRGLLCDKCNMALGQFDDNPKIIQAAVEYLKSFLEN